MALTPMRDLLHAARAHRYAVGYFEAWDQYSFEAVLGAAEESRSPVILGFGGVMMDQEWFSGGGLRGLAALGRALAETATVPVALLLNEVASLRHIEDGLRWGFNAVMLDTCHLPLDQNIAATRRVVALAHAAGADVEGELDVLPDASGTMGQPGDGGLTDPEQAARYVAETQVDALSIAIGNVHVLTDGKAQIDLAHLALLHERVPAASDAASDSVPFVLHGGTGFPEAAIPQAIELGVAKFNVGTILKQRFLEGVRDALAALPDRPNVQRVVGSRTSQDVLATGRARMQAEVLSRMAQYGCMGRG